SPTPVGGPSGSGTPAESGPPISPPASLTHTRSEACPLIRPALTAAYPPPARATTPTASPPWYGHRRTPPARNVSPPSSETVTPHRPVARIRPGCVEPGGRETKSAAPATSLPPCPGTIACVNEAARSAEYAISWLAPVRTRPAKGYPAGT